MKNILESVKKLYANENRVKQHVMYASLLFFVALPFFCISFLQNNISILETQIILILSAVFAVLSIIPFFAIAGATIDYYNGRLNNQTGLFDVTLKSVVKGIKFFFPLGLVWMIYFTCVTMLPIALVLPFLILNVHKINSMILVLLIILALLVFMLYLMLICLFILPFVSYVVIEYAKDYKHKGFLYNPLVLFKYMKKAFASTVITNLKLYIANMILNIAYNIVGFIVIAMLFVWLFVIVLILNPSAEMIDKCSNLLFVPVIILATLLVYMQGILSLAGADIYVKIYKTEIEPQEISEESQESEEPTDEE
jgi:hypothetical protein